jgi:hypothetical protein
MAYMTKDGGGPYPNKAGEFCGNHLPNSKMNFYPRDPEGIHNKEYWAKMRFGRPHSCKAGTTEEMEARGYVGLYLKEDTPLFDWEVEVPTPPELMEPK